MHRISTVKKILLVKNKEKLSIKKIALRFELSTGTAYEENTEIINKNKKINYRKIKNHFNLYYKTPKKLKISPSNTWSK